jgi:hypothetical protein
MMSKEQLRWSDLLVSRIAEADRLIDQERSSDVIDVVYLRSLKARSAELRAELQRLYSLRSGNEPKFSS